MPQRVPRTCDVVKGAKEKPSPLQRGYISKDMYESRYDPPDLDWEPSLPVEPRMVLPRAIRPAIRGVRKVMEDSLGDPVDPLKVEEDNITAQILALTDKRAKLQERRKTERCVPTPFHRTENFPPFRGGIWQCPRLGGCPWILPCPCPPLRRGSEPLGPPGLGRGALER